jgi:hypothetical protein
VRIKTSLPSFGASSAGRHWQCAVPALLMA